MDKERLTPTDIGFSEEKTDLALDKGLPTDQVKPARNTSVSVAGGAGNIFDPQNKKKTKNQPQQPR